MTTQAALEPQDATPLRAHEVIGNDGLTGAERDEYAARYRASAGSRYISAAEKQAIQAWLEQHPRAS